MDDSFAKLNLPSNAVSDGPKSDRYRLHKGPPPWEITSINRQHGRCVISPHLRDNLPRESSLLLICGQNVLFCFDCQSKCVIYHDTLQEVYRLLQMYSAAIDRGPRRRVNLGPTFRRAGPGFHSLKISHARNSAAVI